MLPSLFLNYMEFFQDYFSFSYVDIGLIIGISILFTSYIAFRFSKSSRAKSRFLVSMIVTSASLWVFVLSSLAFCMILIQQYDSSPLSAIFLVARLALAISVVLGVASVLVIRRRAILGVYQSIKNQSVPIEHAMDVSGDTLTSFRLSKLFKYLDSRGAEPNRSILGIRPVLVKKEAALPASLAFDSRGSRIIAVKEDVVDMLDDDELEAVLAHELGHIKHRDAFLKSIATAYRVAFPFDLITRLVEAAIYRQRELDADDFSAQLTEKPISLASALLKIYENIQTKSMVVGSHISFLVNDNDAKKSKRLNLFSKEPALALRIQRLLRISETRS